MRGRGGEENREEERRGEERRGAGEEEEKMMRRRGEGRGRECGRLGQLNFSSTSSCSPWGIRFSED